MNEQDVEKHINRYGMTHLLTMIELICIEKGQHLRVNWKDEASARVWENGAKRVYRAALFNWPL